MYALGERLKRARESLGLTQEDVERATGIGKSSLSEFESEKREPRLAQLRLLAECYRQPLSYFLREDEPKPQPVLWRLKPDPAAAATLEAELRRLAHQYHTLELIVGGRPASDRLRDLQWEGCCPDDFSYPMAESLACKVRDHLGVGDAPGGRLLDILEQTLEIKVFHLDFEPTGTAACTFSEEYGGAILLNARNPRTRRNFDLAHELFHLLTWNAFRAEACEPACPSDREEKLANCFARNLLIPRDSLLKMWNQMRKTSPFPPVAVCSLARYFDVSIDALGWQIKWVFNLSEDQTRRLIDSAKTLEPIRENPENGIDRPPVRPARFEELAREALQAGLISIGKYAEFMGIPRHKAMEEYTRLLEADFDTSTEAGPLSAEHQSESEGSHP